MPTIRITRNIFEYRLNTDLKPRASIHKHIVQMRFQAVIRARFNGNSDSFGLGLLRVQNGLVNGG